VRTDNIVGIAATQATISISCLRGFQSTLNCYYKEWGIVDGLNGNCSALIDTLIIAGYKRTVVQKKENGIMKAQERKLSIPFVAYQTLMLLVDSFYESYFASAHLI
jgi:hypothetical protein